MKIQVEPKKVATALTLIVVCLTLAHTLGQFFYLVLGHDYVYGFVPLFNLNMEQNVPTLYASVTLLLCSAMLLVIAAASKRDAQPYWAHWAGLAAVFLFMAVDESVEIHERLGPPLRAMLGARGPLYFAWVIVYGILGLGLLIVYLKFLINLRPRTRVLCIIAGSIYVTGALGFELLEGPQVEAYGHTGWAYAVFGSMEEVLEMAGIVIFIYALLDYMGSEIKQLQVHITASDDPPLVEEE